MTCVYPSPTSPLNRVPKLQTLAQQSQSRSQYYYQRSLSTDTPFNKSAILNDTVDNNDKHAYKSKAVYDNPMCYMKHEANRLKSFENGWPLSFIKPAECAAVGLYYLGEGDRVQCAFCTGIIASWEEGDKPLVEHVKHFPMCPYLLNSDVGNIPISGSNSSQAWRTANAHPERVVYRRNQPSFRIKYPSMDSFDKRLHTFYCWQNNVTSDAKKPEDLAESGFFYTGVADAVTCFCCGGQVGDWKNGDDTWTEHAKHYPTCSFVKFKKGPAFIEQARKKYISDNATNENDWTVSAPAMLSASACALPPADTCTFSPADTCTFSPESTCAASADEHSILNEDTDVNMVEEMKAMQITENAEDDGNKRICKVCMNLDNRTVFFPCGHSLVCPNCAKELRVCPMCRSGIQSFVRLYLD